MRGVLSGEILKPSTLSIIAFGCLVLKPFEIFFSATTGEIFMEITRKMVVGQKLTGQKLTEKLKNGQKLTSEYVVNEKIN